MPARLTCSTPKNCSQGLMRAAHFLEHFALNGGPGKPAELGDELPHRAIAPQVAIPGHMRGEITLQPGLVVPMRAGRIARSPFFPIGVGRRNVDELLAVPGPAQSQMRVEPDIALGEPYELASRVVQERRAAIVDHRPVDRDPRSYLDRRWRGGVGNPRFVVDVVDPEFDAVFDAAGLDDCHAHRLGIAALALAIEHVAHRQDRLERVALRAAGRRHVSLAARHPDRVVQDRLDGAGLDAAARCPR